MIAANTREKITAGCVRKPATLKPFESAPATFSPCRKTLLGEIAAHAGRILADLGEAVDDERYPYGAVDQQHVEAADPHDLPNQRGGERLEVRFLQNHDRGAPRELDHRECAEQIVRVHGDVRYPISTRSLKRRQDLARVCRNKRRCLGEAERGDDEEQHRHPNDSGVVLVHFVLLSACDHRLAPSRQESQAVTIGAAELKELLRCGFRVCLLLNRCGLKCLLALQVGQHQFAQLHELLNFLL